MSFEVDLRKFFTPAAIAKRLKTLSPITTTIIDLVYKDKKNHPFPVLGIDEVSALIKNVPVVRRGTPAIALSGGERAITYIEPQPVEVSDFLGGVDLNNLKLLTSEGVEQLLLNKTDKFRRTIRKTAEALAAQSLTGTISYPMAISGGYDVYEVNFGSTLEYSPASLWSSDSVTIGQIINDLTEMDRLIKTSGYGGKIVHLIGQDAYKALMDKVLGVKFQGIAKLDTGVINLAGFELRLITDVYVDVNTGNTVPVVPSNKVCAISLDAPFTLYYCAIDDVDAGLKGLPYFEKVIKQDDPSGYKIVAKSKPLPVPVPKAICWATVA